MVLPLRFLVHLVGCYLPSSIAQNPGRYPRQRRVTSRRAPHHTLRCLLLLLPKHRLLLLRLLLLLDSAPQEDLVIHASLYNQQARRDKRFLEELSLEHLNEMLYPELLNLLGTAHMLLLVL